MGKTKNTRQEMNETAANGKKKKSTSNVQQQTIKETASVNKLSINRVLTGIGLLALTIYSGWLIFQAPEISGMELTELQAEMGFLGGLIYLLMHGLMGKGIVLFPLLFCLSGLTLLSGKQLSQIQITGGVLAACALLTVLHMNVTYVDIKDNLLLGLGGAGGGIVGAVFSMILQKLLGTVGSYIVLFCIAVVALVLLAQGAVLERGEDFFSAVRHGLEQIKETLIHFIFIEEEDEENETVSSSEKPKKRTDRKEQMESVSNYDKEETAAASKRRRTGVQKTETEESIEVSIEESVPEKASLFTRVKALFVKEEDEPAARAKEQDRYVPSEFVVIPKEKPVILNSLVEIHKALDEQEPRVGLSPREPLAEEKYLISDSVDDFQQLLDKRQVNYTMTTMNPTGSEEMLKKIKQKRQAQSNETETVQSQIMDMDHAAESAASSINKIEPKKPELADQKEQKPANKTGLTGSAEKHEKITEQAVAMEELFPEEPQVVGYQLPSIELLDINKNSSGSQNRNEIMGNVERLEKTLHDFGVKGKIADVSCGPAITQYEFQPAAGVKVSKIVGLSDDIALSMAVAGVRIEAPIPGKAAVGIEIPNKSTTMVGLRELIESEAFQNSKSKLTVALGKDISGNAIVADLAKMPHLLIAGSTGSGKSVCINTLINSILYKATPDEVKFVMVDPKKVELGNYNGIPHLISPVVTDAKKAAAALRWAVHEMDRRYEVFAAAGVKDMPRFNKLSEERIAAAQSEEEKAAIEVMPYIVVLIDELADLMMVAPADVEDAICRLAQLARAAGIHLVVATQRPSVDVITGIIKANMPSRIAFAVSSQTDSRTILDMGGAEKLLGRGDMLFYPTGMPKPQRVQGVYVSDKEIDRITEAVKNQAQPVYNEEIGNAVIQTEKSSEPEEEWDDLIPDATKLFIENGQASISLLQRRFRVGYNRAARIVDQMEQRGLVGPYEGSKPRQIKVTMAMYNEMIENGEL